MHDERSYTKEEADALVAELTVRLLRLRDAFAEISHHQARIREVFEGNGGDPSPEKVIEAGLVVGAEITWLAEKQIILRDAAQGLIDFPSERQGHPIFLCWRLGEESVEHWHDINSGFGGRQPL